MDPSSLNAGRVLSMVGTHSAYPADAQHPGELRIAAKRTRENADRFIEEVEVDDRELASHLRIEERESGEAGAESGSRPSGLT